ncbi:hypothetical protein GQX74_001959 [Glossina fuscipes]|nr:hypothetical protein GQX74_001959 [Glossina fuscipes]
MPLLANAYDVDDDDHYDDDVMLMIIAMIMMMLLQRIQQRRDRITLRNCLNVERTKGKKIIIESEESPYAEVSQCGDFTQSPLKANLGNSGERVGDFKTVILDVATQYSISCDD